MPSLLTATPPRRPLSLPPTSPFSSPFTDAASPFSPLLRDPPVSTLNSSTSSYAFNTPQTASSSTSFDVSNLPFPAQALRTAYIAGRSSADLINVLDLCTPRTREKLFVETQTDSEKMKGIISRPIPQTAAKGASAVVKETGGGGDGGGVHGQGGGDVASAANNTEDDEAGSESDFGIASPLFITAAHPFPAAPPRPPRPAVSPFDAPADQGEQEVIIDPPHQLSAFHHPSPRSIDPASPTASSPPTTGRSTVPTGQSFFRWSATGSSVAPSDFSPPPSFVDTYAPTELQFASTRREHERTEEEDKDKSFLRLTRTTFYSDFSAPSTVPDVLDAALPPIFKRGQSTGAATGAVGGSGLTAIPEASATSHVGGHKDREDLSPIEGLPTVREKEKRSSAGTFGHKAPRYNSIHSTTSSAFSPPGSVAASPEQYTPGSRTSRHLFSDRVVVSDEPRVVPPRRRPLSFSSSSTVTGSAHTGPPSMSSDDSALAARQALGMLVSPTRRAVHKHPESEQAIQAHLRKASQGNERRIIPAKKDDGLGPAIELGGEEMERGATPAGRGAGMGMGKRSKVDQLLGEGAEFARATMGMDKMTLDGTVEQRLGGPLPPPRYHKASASLPINSIPSPTKSLHSPTSPRSPHQGGHLGALVSPGRGGGFPHGRSSSIDSLPSLHPSLSESINTLAERRPLLSQSAHTQTYATAGPGASHTAPSPSRQPPLTTTTTTLTPSQRTMLLRRTRKLEQVLGESLPEQQISRHVVDPLNGVTTFDTRVAEDAWPESPMPGAPGAAGRRTPEWEREDCVPQRVKNDPYATGAGAGGKPGLSRSGSTLAKKAKAAFSLGGGGGEKKDSAEDLRVYVSRQMRVTQTISRGSSGNLPGLPLQSVNREDNGGKGSTGSGESELVSPVSAKSGSTVEEVERDEETRRNRRQQLAKLHRLLGAPIPPELLNPTVIEQSSTPYPSSSRTQTPTPMARTPSPSEQSFMTFDEPSTSGTKWSTKLKSLNARRKAMGSSAGSMLGSGSVYGGGGVVGHMADDASFMDMRDGKKVSKEEKQAARKRAAKLEQMLGDKPPVGMYLSPSPSPRATSPPQGERLSAYDAYASSLQGLLYLMDNDQTKLAQVMDSLAATGTSPSRGLDDSPSRQPPTPTGKSSIHSSRTGTPSPPSPLLDSPKSSRYPEGYDFLDMDPEEYYAKEEKAMGAGGAGGADPQSHSARRRRTGKLSQFFGESVDLTKSPEDLAMTPPRSRQSISAARQSAHGGGIGLASGGGGGAGNKWKARRKTMDAMLGELWRSVQTEVGRGGLKLDEVDRLGDLMGTLNERRRAKERPWEMI
ncbi:hypothetical protein IAT38_002268 [Cryptococcus sp. DSM 104549]